MLLSQPLEVPRFAFPPASSAPPRVTSPRAGRAGSQRACAGRGSPYRPLAGLSLLGGLLGLSQRGLWELFRFGPLGPLDPASRGGSGSQAEQSQGEMRHANALSGPGHPEVAGRPAWAQSAAACRGTHAGPVARRCSQGAERANPRFTQVGDVQPAAFLAVHTNTCAGFYAALV